MMQAYCCRQYGNPDALTLEEVAIPTMGERDILVKVVASTVSSADARLRAANYPRGFGLIGRLALGLSYPTQIVLGSEAAGIVYRVGPAVGEFKVGDEVILMDRLGMGCHATFKRMPADGPVVLKPKGIDFSVAAALPFGGMTAMHFLDKAKLTSGQSVLVSGASGCVGSAAVQIATESGATVTAVCRSTEIVTLLGAKHVIDYRKTPIHRIQQRFDLVFDSTGLITIDGAKQLLKPQGKAVLLAADLGTTMLSPLAKLLWGIEVFCGSAIDRKGLLVRLVKLMQDGAFHPVVESCFDFEGLVKAHRLVDSGHKRGSAVVLHYAPRSSYSNIRLFSDGMPYKNHSNDVLTCETPPG